MSLKPFRDDGALSRPVFYVLYLHLKELLNKQGGIYFSKQVAVSM